eukprot:GHVU01011256.1.p1 GENE.GHVU01011256.1~~GHVU01011256.1.p1  ORF type:complete len:211 (-),score=42.54 GHVU01011256.1:179-811(-)
MKRTASFKPVQSSHHIPTIIMKVPPQRPPREAGLDRPPGRVAAAAAAAASVLPHPVLPHSGERAILPSQPFERLTFTPLPPAASEGEDSPPGSGVAASDHAPPDTSSQPRPPSPLQSSMPAAEEGTFASVVSRLRDAMRELEQQATAAAAAEATTTTTDAPATTGTTTAGATASLISTSGAVFTATGGQGGGIEETTQMRAAALRSLLPT